MVRLLLFALLGLPAFALDSNGPRITERTGSTQTDRKFRTFWQLAPDEICAFPRPYFNGSSPSVWQVKIHSRYDASAACPSGAVKNFYAAFHATLTGSATAVVDFRNSTDPCSAGNQAACDGEALSEAEILAHAGWGGGDIVMSATPAPNGGALSAQTVSARTMIDAGHFTVLKAGPEMTEILVEDRSSSRTYDFGWRHKRIFRGTTTFNSTATSITVVNLPDNIASLPRPFLMSAHFPGGNNEVISICFVSGNVLTVGTTNGSDATCADVAGRAQEGSSAQNFTGSAVTGTGVQFSVQWDTLTTSSISSGATSIPVDSTTNPGFPFIAWMHTEAMRICNTSGSNFVVGHGTGGSCSGSTRGRKHWQTTDTQNKPNGSPVPGANTPIHFLEANEDWWIAAEVATEKSLHPAFVIQLWADGTIKWEGWLENVWLDRAQDQWFDLSISDDDGVKYDRDGITMAFGTRLTFPVTSTTDAANPGYWIGTAPGEIRVDFNFPYKKHIGIIPNDPSVSIAQSLINTELTGTSGTQDCCAPSPGYELGDGGEFDNFVTGDASPNTYRSYIGPTWRDWPGPGGRVDLAPIPRMGVTAAYAWSSSLTNAHKLNAYALSLGSVSGRFAHHFRESKTTGAYCNVGHYPANTADMACPSGHDYNGLSPFGLPVSLGVRPTFTNWSFNNVAAADVPPPPIGPTSSNGITFNSISYAHSLGHMAYIAAMMAGRKFDLDELVWHGHIALTQSSIPNYNAGADLVNRWRQRGCDTSYCPGWVGDDSGYRATAWMHRDLGNGAWAAADGTPEKAYLVHYFKSNMAILLGFFNVTGLTDSTMTDSSLCGDMSSTPNRNNPWCFGRSFKGRNAPNVVYGNGSWTGGHQMHSSNAANSWQANDPAYVWSTEGQWHNGYANVSRAINEGQGLPLVRQVRTTHQRNLLNILNGTGGVNPFLSGVLELAMSPCLPEGSAAGGGNCGSQTMTYGGQHWFSAWSYLQQGINTPMKTCNYFGGANGGGGGACTAGQDNCYDLQGGYCRIMMAQSAFLLDGVSDPANPAATGTKAWAWVQANVRVRNTDGDNPMWITSPPESVLISNIRQVGDSLLFTRFDGSACEYRVNPTDSTNTGATAIAAGKKNVAIDISMLSPDDVVRIDCGYRGGPKYARESFTIQ